MVQRLTVATCLLAATTGVSDPACPGRAREAPAPAAKTAQAPIPVIPTPAPTRPDLFTASVRPVLVARCAPCHEVGGKMYEKLPFDNPETIAGHRAGVLRRFQGEDRAAIEAWLKSQPETEAR